MRPVISLADETGIVLHAMPRLLEIEIPPSPRPFSWLDAVVVCLGLEQGRAMNDDQFTAYRADQRAKGAGAAAHKQRPGFPASPGCVNRTPAMWTMASFA